MKESLNSQNSTNFFLVAYNQYIPEAAKLSNCTPAEALAPRFLFSIGEKFSDEDTEAVEVAVLLPLRSNKSLSMSKLDPGFPVFGVWTEYTSPMAESKLTQDLVELAEQCLERFNPDTDPDLHP